MLNKRDLRVADLTKVVEIEQAANRFPWSYKNFEDCLLAGHHAWAIVDQQDEIIGYTIIQVIVDELHLLNICIAPKFQGQGYGRELLNEVIELADEHSASVVLLEVRRSNHRAQQLYLQSGFNEVSVRRGYYPAENGREDAILMAMDLSFSFH
jgi:ribosomal-protein-alanine N-acetyltransferase